MPRIIVTACLLVLLVRSAGAAPEADSAASEEAPDFGIAGIHAPELEELAMRTDRPEWAPLPVMWGHSEMVPVLTSLLSEGDTEQRQRAAFLLGQIGHLSACAPLVQATRDGCRDVRIQAGIALACLGDQRGQKAAEAALIGEPTWIRYYAVLGLSRLNSDSARHALQAMQPGQPDFINRTIAAALAEPAPVLPPAADKEEASVSTGEASAIWQAVIGALKAESDWWWHWGDYSQCIRCLEVILLMDPDLVETYSDVAWLQWSLGYNTEAIGTYHRAIQILPDNPLSHYYLGWHYFNLKKYKLALPYLRKAVELGAKGVGWRVYAHALERLGQLEASFKQWEEMYEETPEFPATKFNYERLQRLLGEQ